MRMRREEEEEEEGRRTAVAVDLGRRSGEEMGKKGFTTGARDQTGFMQVSSLAAGHEVMPRSLKPLPKAVMKHRTALDVKVMGGSHVVVIAACRCGGLRLPGCKMTLRRRWWTRLHIAHAAPRPTPNRITYASPGDEAISDEPAPRRDRRRSCFGSGRGRDALLLRRGYY